MFLLYHTSGEDNDSTKLLFIAFHIFDVVYANHEVPNSNDHIFILIEPEELVSAQLQDRFCSYICFHL